MQALNLFFFLLVGALVVLFFRNNVVRRRKAAAAPSLSPRKAHRLLLKHIRFYRRLDREAQAEFRQRAKAFLDTVPITPVGKLKIKDLDRIYVAAAAIIPIFHFKDWSYKHLNEVLLYPGNFAKDFSGEAEKANVMGMVGDGAMHRMMVLSIGALRTGFEQAGRGNTGIHEFVHLLDKADGAVDGVPEAMLPEALTKPWLEYTHRAIAEIRAGHSDINPYGATNEAEFFAVISEYFFQRPDDLHERHPELWSMLQVMYTGDADAAARLETEAIAEPTAQPVA